MNFTLWRHALSMIYGGLQPFPSRLRERLGVSISRAYPYRPTPSPSRKREGSFEALFPQQTHRHNPGRQPFDLGAIVADVKYR